MKIPLTLIGLTFWVCFSSLAQGQGCLRSDIKLENTERLEKHSYSHGDTVKVSCVPGYSGIYKFVCNDGNWKKVVERECIKRKCGHPGDAENGMFTLLEGNSEFVFGATVEYTCNKGYEMVSRINQRTCRSSGWDNTVPSCEVKKCPPIYTKEGMIASGNTEEGSYSDVVHFECVSSNQKIDGKTDIHCTENGQWSDPVPKCIEITCTVPDIPHGSVTFKLVLQYKKDAMLQYECDVGYKPRQGTPKCTKYGWSLEPECEEITCELKETKFGIQKLEPQGKTLFRVGQTVQIICAERYRIFHSKKKVETFTCKPDGQWDSNPVCELIRCEVPRDRRLSYPHYYFSGELTLDVKKNYWCLPGFKKMADQATCTEDGWKPDPLCAEFVCDPPNIPNAQIRNPDPTRTQYEISSTIVYNCDPGFEPEQQIQITCNSQGKWSGIQPCTENKQFCTTPDLENGYVYPDSRKQKTIFYSCYEGYKPFSGNWWGGARCTHGHWSDDPRCIRVEECGSLPSVAHGRVRKTNNPDEQSAEVECDPGFKPSHAFIRCVSGTWEKPACELDQQHCVNPPKVQNAVITSIAQEWYSQGSHVVYVCRKHFQMRGNNNVFCDDKTWSTPPICEAFCPEPLLTIENGILIDETRNERKYLHGDTVRYKCADGYEYRGETIAKCEINSWIYPKCIVIEIKCTAPDIPHGTALPKTEYHKDAILQYQCDVGYKPREETSRCTKHGWSVEPECEVVAFCPEPRLTIENGILIDETRNERKYLHGDTVRYKCADGYESRGETIAKCEINSWIYPKCIVIEITCTAPDIPHGTALPKTEYHKDAILQYQCDVGYKPREETSRCTKHGWSVEPECEEVVAFCPEPRLTIENGILIDETRNERKYLHGDTVHYKCDDGYESRGETIAKCEINSWIYPKCIVIEITCTAPDIPHGTALPKTEYHKDAILQYQCDVGYKPREETSRCTKHGWSMEPECEEVVAFCPEPHWRIENGILIDENQDERKYLHGDTVHYKCADGYESRGETIAKCEINSWIYPKCIEITQCDKPTKYLQFVTLSDEKNVFNNFDILTYTCNKPYDDIPGGTLMCENKEWIGTFQCTSRICPPPPYIENGEFKIERKSGDIITSVSYTCQRFYVPENTKKKIYRCQNKKWDAPLKCLSPCEVTPTILQEYNIQPVQDGYIQHSNKNYKLDCRPGWNTGGTMKHEYTTATCSNGELKIKDKCNEKNDINDDII